MTKQRSHWGDSQHCIEMMRYMRRAAQAHGDYQAWKWTDRHLWVWCCPWMGEEGVQIEIKGDELVFGHLCMPCHAKHIFQSQPLVAYFLIKLNTIAKTMEQAMIFWVKCLRKLSWPAEVGTVIYMVNTECLSFHRIWIYRCGRAWFLRDLLLFT